MSVEEREFLLQSLRDLEREYAAGDIDEDDYRALKDDYTARAAAILKGQEPEPATTRSRNWRRIAVGTLVVVVVAAVSSILVVRSSGERLGGQSASGSIRPTSASTLDRAHALYDEGKLLESLKLYGSVLKKDPENPVALAYSGWITIVAGMQGNQPDVVDRGLAYVDKALAADPGYAIAHWFKALALLQAKNDAKGAVPEIEAFLDGGPPPAMVKPAQEVLRAAREAAAGRAPAPTTTAP